MSSQMALFGNRICNSARVNNTFSQQIAAAKPIADYANAGFAPLFIMSTTTRTRKESEMPMSQEEKYWEEKYWAVLYYRMLDDMECWRLRCCWFMLLSVILFALFCWAYIEQPEVIEVDAHACELESLRMQCKQQKGIIASQSQLLLEIYSTLDKLQQPSPPDDLDL